MSVFAIVSRAGGRLRKPRPPAWLYQSGRTSSPNKQKERGKNLNIQHNPITVRALALIVFALAGALYVQAGALLPEDEPARKWVSPDGNDNNSCSRTQPCRTFNAALALVADDGEVIARDSGSYAPTTITKSVTISAPPSVYAAIDAPAGGDAITISATPLGVVVLRNLSVKSKYGGTGIFFRAGSRLSVEQCAISGFAGAGINYVGEGLANDHLLVADSVVKSCETGLRIRSARATINHTRIEGTGAGVLGIDGTFVVRDSIISKNQIAFQARNENHSLTRRFLENCLVTGNQVGLKGDSSFLPCPVAV